MSQSNSFLSKEQELALQIADLQRLLKREREKNQNYEKENNWLREQLSTLKRNQFGAKSERWESSEQLVFNEAEVLIQNPAPEKDDYIVEVKGHTKKVHGHRKPLPEHLSREVIKVELPESEQFSEQGDKLKVIGWEISEKLKYEPAKISVIEYHRAKYGVDSGDYEKTAPPIPSVIPKGIATPELLAAIIVGKYSDGLPLYRLEEIFSRQDVELNRTTMARWMVKVSESLLPIRNVLSDRMFSSHAISCDETSVQVLKENGREAEAKSWMIVRATPCDKNKIVLFDYTTSRSGEVMKQLFAGYEGRLLCDGLDVYNALESDTLIRFGCHMHARRKFEQAAKDGAKSGKTMAAEIMDIYTKLYDFEEKVRFYPPEERVKSRLREQKHLLKKIKSLADANIEKIPDKSKLGQAFKYYQNEYIYLTRYLEDGLMEPDNGFTERAIRKFAIGRNNWLFSDSPAGAEASSLLYSLVITAKLNGVNAYKALSKILIEVPLAKTLEDYERLADIILTPELSA
jgi:transposase